MSLESQQNYVLILLNKLKSIIYDIYKTCIEFSESLQRNKFNKSRHSLLILFNRIIRHLIKAWCRFIRTFYWLLAPNMLIKLGLRHIVLFSIMFACPSIIRLTIKPFFKWFRYHIFLRIVMGKEWVSKYRQIKKQSYDQGVTYKQYAECVSKLDEMEGLYAWRINRYSPLYSHNRLHQDLLELSKFRRKCENYILSTKQQQINNVSNRGSLCDSLQHPMRELMEFLRSRIERNYCSMNNPKLYSMTKVGTKKLIEDFIDGICQSLIYIANNNDDESISIGEKIVFFNEIRHVLGRTALCLSGGGSLGAYHIGVVLAMYRNGLLPKIITGSSVGSVVSALVCTKLDDEIETLTKDGVLNLKYFDRKANRRWITGIYVRLRRFWQTGHFLDVTVLRDCVRDNIGDITFLEAYQKTGRILNITVSGSDANTMPRLLNFLTAPNVVIWSAVIASCAIPFVFEPQELYIKSSENKIEPIYLQGVTFSDGSVSHDLPMNKLSQLFNVDNFIVSQVNPHLVPFLFHSIVAPIPLFERLFRFLGHEFHLYLTTVLVNLREFGILRGFGFINDLFTQKYTGDVTIVPDVLVSDYLHILSNPSLNYIQRCSNMSEQSTWKHLSRLQGLCAVEFTIDECLHNLRSKLVLLEHDQQQSRSMNRIASFQAPIGENKNRHLNHLHIPQSIYSSILDNQPVDGRDINDMESVRDDDEDEVEEKLNGAIGIGEKSHSSPQLQKQRKQQSSSTPDSYDMSSGAGDSNNSLHKSMSVADLCSDLPNIM